jgi:glycosyltransferase involved in cell wall biosynthesis
MRSVLEQGYPNLEYVVMDGGSKDETGEILARYRDRVTYCESAPDKGQADAVVRGFAHTNGEIMAYLNSDDVLAPGALDFAARFFAAHPEVDAVYSHRVFIDESNIVTRYWILPPHHTWMMQRWDYIPQETCFWRRRIYEKVGGIDPSFQFALDYDLFVRFMEQGRMERANRFLGAFREHSSSKTVNQEGAHPEVERVYQERGIRVRPWHRLPQLAQFELLDVRSSRFAARGKILPGAMPGIGYNYDLVWGGRLNGPRSSSRNNSGIHRT